MRKLSFQTDLNQNNFIISKDHSNLFDHKNRIDPGKLFSI